MSCKFNGIGVTPVCPSCSQKVYFAEEVRVLNNVYHKRCLRCFACNKCLELGNVNDHDQKIYCKICYNKQFGPKGYGYAAGAAGLTADGGQPFVIEKSQNGHANGEVSEIAAKFGGGGDACARCNSVVYFNERLQSSGQVFHTNCFKCSECLRRLEAGSECEHGQEVFCRGCYTRLFGPKGFSVGSTSMNVS